MKLVAAALLGAVATLGFPPYKLYPLSLLALLGLVFLWQQAAPRRAALLGLCFGLGHFLSGIYWVFISTHVYGGAPLWMGLLLTLLLSLYGAVHLALAGFLATWRRPASPALWALLQVPAAWLLAELLRDWHPVWSFPWLSLGYVFIDTPLARLAPVFGVHGISLLVLALAALLYLLIQGKRSERLIAAGAGLLLGIGLWLLPAPGAWTQAEGEPLSVGLAQGNIPQERKWLPSERLPTLQLYRGLSQELLAENPGLDLIIWPEAAIPMLYHDVRSTFLVDLRQWSQENNLAVLAGMLQRSPDGLFNTMRLVGQDEGLYLKRHLVPFGEFFPVPDFLRRFMQGINLDYENLSHGPLEQALITVSGVAVGISICFEDVFGADIRRDLPQAGWLVNVTNDAWFADSSAAPQHLQIARMRALETGRELLRVSNRGVSGRILANGQLQESLPMFRTAYLALQVQPRSGSTPLTRWGDWPLRLLAAMALLAVFLGGRGRRAA